MSFHHYSQLHVDKICWNRFWSVNQVHMKSQFDVFQIFWSYFFCYHHTWFVVCLYMHHGVQKSNAALLAHVDPDCFL